MLALIFSLAFFGCLEWKRDNQYCATSLTRSSCSFPMNAPSNKRDTKQQASQYVKNISSLCVRMPFLGKIWHTMSRLHAVLNRMLIVVSRRANSKYLFSIWDFWLKEMRSFLCSKLFQAIFPLFFWKFNVVPFWRLQFSFGAHFKPEARERLFSPSPFKKGPHPAKTTTFRLLFGASRMPSNFSHFICWNTTSA